ncbi:hypothetical protein L6164_026373 [Bauhinia variegata]|uniref:Uncharacterized protein n=1 Tax=Bauhinia variegata TaxID=167791 RepID=A0ACB9LQ88_BAUVA|nr:hypothetical protein L6164_026373 [Bauhinia variegata]
MSIQCLGKSSWPELLGANGEEAVKKIDKENPYVRAFVILKGTIVTMDYRCDRVRVWINKHGVVVEVPRIG